MTPDPSLDASTEVGLCLERIRAGDAQAREQLLSLTSSRLVLLARKMLQDYPSVRRWEQTDDVLQNAVLRLHRALGATVPDDARGFFRLAAVQLRRELIDLARHYMGPEGLGAHHASQGGLEPGPEGALEPADATHDPGQLASWTEFHAAIERLDEAERSVMDLLWYQGLTQREAGVILGLTERVVGSHWRSARLKLHRALKGQLPGL